MIKGGYEISTPLKVMAFSRSIDVEVNCLKVTIELMAIFGSYLMPRYTFPLNL